MFYCEICSDWMDCENCDVWKEEHGESDEV